MIFTRIFFLIHSLSKMGIQMDIKLLFTNCFIVWDLIMSNLINSYIFKFKNDLIFLRNVCTNYCLENMKTYILLLKKMLNSYKCLPLKILTTMKLCKIEDEKCLKKLEIMMLLLKWYLYPSVKL